MAGLEMILARSPKNFRRLLIHFAAPLLIGVLAGCSSPSNASKPSGGPSREAVPVSMATVIEKDVPLELQSIGTVEANSTVNIKAQVEGIISKVHFKEGQEVRKGDLLFSLDPRTYEAELARAKANLARDKVLAANAAKDAARYEDMMTRSAVSQEDYDRTLSNSESLAATVQADEAAIQSAQIQLDYCSIGSPIDGRTGSLLVHEGNLVKANSDNPLVVIHQIQPVRVTFSIPEKYLPLVKEYMAKGTLPVEAITPGLESEPVAGKLDFVDNTVDAQAGTVIMKGIFPNEDESLWPGLFVKVLLKLTVEKNATLVPEQAVQQGQDDTYVYVVKTDKTVELRPVSIRRTYGETAVVEKGLRPGELIVTDGQLRLTPGAKVEEKRTTGTLTVTNP